ncbi:MAG: heavy-metal-associated domain-containing protein [Candidatus Dojkabacteria bacterium]
MNKFSIDIKGIHCTGCVNLIKLVLEDDINLLEVSVDPLNNKANFLATDADEILIKKLDLVFKTTLEKYEYSNLIKL